MKNVCVFASSSTKLAAIYKKEARELGRRIAQRGWGIVFGAGTEGLMGELARGAAEFGGSIIGVIPDLMNKKGIVYEQCTTLYDTRTVRERKAIMEEKADAFIALPGGFGTLEEILEIITLKQLGYHSKPVVLLNTNGFFDHLIAQFDKTVSQSFAEKDALSAFAVFNDIDAALQYVDTYDPAGAYKKYDD
ncbi:MAG: TIGR00730 family Rossman fold protein [Eubacteriales bacterium]|nr:TIGR00730 family Rossman fold protein [Eubacteriales bacterium]